MQPATLFAILSAIAPFALAVCCYSNNDGICADCTRGTPYCGKGACNIFGCDCVGGCRSRQATTAAMSGVDERTAIADAFSAANVDGTGKLTLQQYTQYIGAQGDDAIYVELFRQNDKNGDGIITLDELIE